MIYYHGTPMGGKRDEVAKFLAGRHAFIPFPRPEDLGVALEACRSVAFDNGAFSIWKKGGTLDVDGYHEWVAESMHHPSFDWAIIPDDIEGDEEANDELLERWPHGRHRGVPVWHFHESLRRLERLSHEWPRVALGSSGQWPNPGTPGWWRRVDEAMRRVCDQHGRPRCKLHGLRMLDPAIFHQIPLASADSTNAARNAASVSRFGMYCPPTNAQRAEIIASRIEQHNSAAVYKFDRQQTLAFV